MVGIQIPTELAYISMFLHAHVSRVPQKLGSPFCQINSSLDYSIPISKKSAFYLWRHLCMYRRFSCRCRVDLS